MTLVLGNLYTDMSNRLTPNNLTGGLACVAAVLLAAAPNLVAADKYWNNTSEVLAGWGTAGNWSPSGAPATTDTAIFNAAGNNGPRLIGLNGNRVIGGLIFNNTGSTTISGGDQNRNFNIGGGGITIDAGAGAVTFGGEGVFSAFPRPSLSQTWQNDSANPLTINNAIRANDLAGLKTLTVTGNGDTIFNANVTGTGDNELSLIKSGAGRLIMAGNALYTGSTIVEQGTLLVNGTNSQLSSGVTVAGGTLGGDGNIAGAVLVQEGGTLGPGASTGLLTLANNLTFLEGSFFNWEFVGNELAVRGTDFDALDLTEGSLSIASGVQFRVLASGVDYSTAFWQSDRQFVAIDLVGEGGLTGGFGMDASGAGAFGAFGAWSVENAANDVVVKWTVIPEPSIAALLALCGGVLLLRGRVTGENDFDGRFRP
jgi:autotransporter-associated beta strand protein